MISDIVLVVVFVCCCSCCLYLSIDHYHSGRDLAICLFDGYVIIELQIDKSVVVAVIAVFVVVVASLLVLVLLLSSSIDHEYFDCTIWREITTC